MSGFTKTNRDMTPSPRKKRKKRQMPWWQGTVALAILGLLLFYVIRASGDLETIELTETTPVTITEAGNAAFFYREYAPDFLSEVNPASLESQEKERVRLDTPLFPLTEPLRNLLSAAKQEGRSASELAYLDAMLSSGSVFMPFSGLLFKGLDGYESLFTIESLSTFLPGDIGSQSVRELSASGIKFVDNRLFYVAVDLPARTDAFPWKIGSSYPMETSGGVALEGRLNVIREAADGRRLLIFSLRDGILRVRKERVTSIELTGEVVKSYRIPVSALFTEGENTFCYVLDTVNVARKTQVHITGSEQDGKFLFVDAEPAESKDFRQIKALDRVIAKPEGIVEGGLY